MDKVSYKLIKGDKADDPFGTIVGKRAFFNAMSGLENLTFEGESDIASAVVGCENTGNNDGLTLIISDFFTDSDWRRAVDYLTYKKRQILLVQVMSPEEADPLYAGRVSLIDSESSDISDPKNIKLNIDRASQLAYEAAIKEITQNIESFCTSRDAHFISVRSDQPIEKVLFKELLKVGIMA